MGKKRDKKNKKEKKVISLELDEITEEERLNEIVTVDDEIEGKEYLTNHELSRITLNAEKHEVFKKDQDISNLKIMLLNTKKELFESRIETVERELVITEYIRSEHTKNYEDFKYKSKKELEEIGKSHGFLLGEQFGYDPESGEIVV